MAKAPVGVPVKEPLVEVQWLQLHSEELPSLPEQIAARIADRIIQGEMAPGARIGEQALAQEFGVSRGPIRDAFRVLEREGLITNLPRRGVTVTLLTEKDLGEIQELNSSLSMVLGRRLASAQSAPAVRLLDQALREARPWVSSPEGAYAIAVIGHRLTESLVREAGNSRLQRIVRRLSLESFRYRLIAFQSESHRRKTLARWRMLRRAIKNGDVDASLQVWTQIIETNRRQVLGKIPNTSNGTKISG